MKRGNLILLALALVLAWVLIGRQGGGGQAKPTPVRPPGGGGPQDWPEGPGWWDSLTDRWRGAKLPDWMTGNGQTPIQWP